MEENTHVNGQRHDRTALVLYGSETGNSEDIAGDLERMLERLHFVTRVSEMDDVELKELPRYSLVIFLISTTGQGDFPRNARKFWKSLLRKRLPPNCLSHMNFTTFGLGDSSYLKFNLVVRKLHKRLLQLGASEFYQKGEADEQHSDGLDGTYVPWSIDLRKSLLEQYPLSAGLSVIPLEIQLPPKVVLELASDSSNQIAQREGGPDIATLPEKRTRQLDRTRSIEAGLTETTLNQDSGGPTHAPTQEVHQLNENVPATLVSNQRVTPIQHSQDVREFKFLVPILKEPLIAGDIMTIYPRNDSTSVEKLITIQSWNSHADVLLQVTSTSPHPPQIPFPCTLRNLLTQHLDISAIPKPYFFYRISSFCSDPDHATRLLEFSQPQFRDEYYDYTTRPRRTILEILSDFPMVQIPWSLALDIFPLIKPRKYSICNGGALRYKDAPEGYQHVHLLVAILNYKTILKTPRKGLATNFLARLEEETKIEVRLESNWENGKNVWSKAIQDLSRPLVMVAPGTGIAPIRSLLWDRAATTTTVSHQPQNILFFGARSSTADNFYASEFTLSSLNTQVVTAFSRDQRQKIYVQDRIRENGKLVYELLVEKKGILIVCGAAGKMPKAVREAVVSALREFGGEVFGDEWSDEAMREGRYIEECW